MVLFRGLSKAVLRILCKTHHKGFVHKELFARCAVIVFGVDGEA